MCNILVLMCTFNRLDQTKECIKSLFKNNDGINFNFVIVDDNSSDGTKEFLKSKDYINVINGNGSLYYSGGMRKAIEYAKQTLTNIDYDYVMMVNNDVKFYPNAINNLIKDSVKVGNSIVAGSTKDFNGELSYGGFIKVSKFRPKFKHLYKEETNYFVDSCNGNCILIPAIIFKKIPNIDAKYVHSLGDYDFGFTITKLGFKIVTSSFFVGDCDSRRPFNHWKNSNLKIKERLKILESPLGNPSSQWFYFLNKNYNIITAILYYFNNILSALKK